MTTDNRTSEPSEAMIRFASQMRSALMAAGVAPQEPSECSNPQCPLQLAHSGPCAPEGWSPDREKLIEEADELIQSWEQRGSWTPNSPIGMIMQLRDALAAQPVLDAEADLRDVAHISCDCVPDLGPEHCHLCSDREGHEVTWTECSSHSLDPERVKTWLQREFGSVLAHDPHDPERFWGGSARALCEAYTEGKLT